MWKDRNAALAKRNTKDVRLWIAIWYFISYSYLTLVLPRGEKVNYIVWEVTIFREVYGIYRDEITRKMATLLDKELCDL